MAVVSPITGDYFSGKGRLYFRLTGATRVEELGDLDDFTISFENERLIRNSNQYGTRTKVDSRLLEQTATIQLTAVQNTARNVAIMFGAEKTFLTQSAVTGSYVHSGVKAGDLVDLGSVDTTIISIRGGGVPTGEYTTGYYEHDTRAGMVKILNIPPTAAGFTGIDVSYTKGAILDTAGRLKVGLGSSPDLEGTLIFISLDADNNPVEKVTLWKVKISPNGDFSMITDEYRTLPMQGEIVADTTQASGFYLGQIEDLTPRTNRGQADA